MRLSKITVSGFRSFADETVIDGLDRINVFVGRNNAGKTNVIEILRLLNGLIDGNQYRRPVDFIARNEDTVVLTLEFSLNDTERTQTIEQLFKDGHVTAKDVAETNFLRNVSHSLKITAQGIVEETVDTTNLVDGESCSLGAAERENNRQMTAKGCDLARYCRELEERERICR